MVAAVPIATVKACRRKGRAVVTVERMGKPARRHCVSLRRYRAFREWLAQGRHPWSVSGAWLAGSLDAALWLKEVRPTN